MRENISSASFTKCPGRRTSRAFAAQKKKKTMTCKSGWSRGLTLFSTLLSVSVLVFWLRSYRISDRWQFNFSGFKDYYRTHGTVCLDLNRGQIQLGRVVSIYLPPANRQADISLQNSHAGTCAALLLHGKRYPLETSESRGPPSERVTAAEKLLRRAGFMIWIERPSSVYSNKSIQWVRVPCWFVAMLIATWSGLRIRRFVLDAGRQARMAEGRCVKCGYDLRATPLCCPECGTVPGGAK